jgi:two-component system phosphate regulon response regulator PhoB
MEAEQPSLGNTAQPVLSATEARLWQVLRSEPGRVFSRSELVALVMPDSVVLERTIDVHIKSLRRKVGSAGSQIETVRGRGYRFTGGAQP